MIIRAFKTTWKYHKRLVVFFYLKSLFLSLTLTAPLYLKLATISKEQPILNVLAYNFDYMLLTDFIRLNSGLFSPLFYKFCILVLINVLLNILFSGGIFDILNTKIYNLKRFVKQCLIRFKANFKIALLLSGLVLGVIILSLSAALILPYWLANPNHKTIVLIHLPTIIMLFVGSIYIFMLWDYSRLISSRNTNLGTFEIFQKAKNLIFSSFTPLRILLVFFLLLSLGSILYLLIEQYLNLILAGFIFQQLFSIYKCFLRAFYINLLKL